MGNCSQRIQDAGCNAMTEEEFKKAMIQFLKQLEGLKKMLQEIVNKIDGRVIPMK